VKKFWAAVVGTINKKALQQVAKEHDAIGALEVVNEALRSM
jgi:hypothetical protein